MAGSTLYQKPVLLDRELHRRRRVRPTPGFAFARKSNALYLAGVEFGEACKEYAIVFTRVPGGRTLPVAMLGLREGENLFVAEDGSWAGRYVPAFVRRYPFVLAQLPGQALAVCIDEACPAVNDEEGDALFEPGGQDTPFLRSALDFLGQYQHEYQRTEAFCQRLEQAGLLVEMSARADLLDGRSFTVAGVYVVDEKKLMALPDAAVLSLFRAGELHLVSMHLASLSNMRALVDAVARRPGAIPPAPLPAAG